MTGTAVTKLKPEHAEFAQYICEGYSPQKAMEMAGFKPLSGTLSNLMQRSDILTEIVKYSRRDLVSRGLPLAIKVLINLLESSTASDRVKLEAAKTIMDRTGILVQKESSESDGKDMSDMGTAELQRTIDQITRELSDRAAPVIQAKANQPIDIFE